MPNRPYALLTFSYDPQQSLHGVGQELAAINKAFVKNCSLPISYWGVQQDQIETAFENYRADIRVFHFAGHAGPSLLQTNDFKGKPRYTFVEGLAKNIGRFGKGLKLVFLNGCSTKEQVECFLDNGIPAVIATRKPIEDSYAWKFALRFYQKFTENNLSLEEAFEAAKDSFDADADHGNFSDRVKRIVFEKFLVERFRSGNFDLEDDDSSDIYDLHTRQANDAVRQEKFTDWFPHSEESYSQAKESDPSKLNTGKKHEDGYLICNREAPLTVLHEAILSKIGGRNPAPYFFMLCGKAVHCPQLLLKRLRLFSLRELYKAGQSPLDPDKSANFFTELPLPGPEKIKIDVPENTFQDRFKIELADIYAEKFGGTTSANNQLATIKPYKEPLLVVHHRLDHGPWRGPEGQQKLDMLLRFYMNEYAHDLQDQLTQRLIVVFDLQLITDDPNLQNSLLPKLEKDFSGQFSVLSNFPDINWGHVQAWERDFLGYADNEAIDIEKFFTIEGENAPRYSLPLKKVIPNLQQQIRIFNQRPANAAY